MTRRMKVLHVVGGLVRGGVETWLLHVARHLAHDRFQLDFLVHTENPCPYDDEIRALGCRILPCPKPQQWWRYGPRFRKIVAENGPYDVLHSHVHHFSGATARLARQCGIPVRVAHSHTDSRRKPPASALRRAYLGLMRRWLASHATHCLAASREAGLALFEGVAPWSVHYCGIDLAPFQAPRNKSELLDELQLPGDAQLVLHVGSFTAAKNHAWLMKVFAEVVARKPRARLALVGDGPLRADVERMAEGFGERVLFLGSRSDVPRLMAAPDAFVLPSLYEGLPLVGLEAQAAGAPAIFSDQVTREVDVAPELVSRVPLAAPASAWADAIVERLSRARPPREQALAQVATSPFDIRRGAKALEEYYAAALGNV